MLRAVVLALLALGGLARAQEYADAEHEMARAAEYYQQGNYRAALAHYEAAQKLAPDKPGPYLWIGLTHAALGECAQAVPAFEQYLKVKQKDPKAEAMRTLAECKTRLTPAQPRLLVVSEPSGAEVRLDDARAAPVGVTPFESGAVEAGMHRVFLSKVGFKPTSGEVKLVPGMIASLNLKLETEAVLIAQPPVMLERKRSKTGLIVGVVVGSVAVVGLAVGLGVGLGLPRPQVLEPIP
jgi:tetratricopeptide (TPR) repeat protein